MLPTEWRVDLQLTGLAGFVDSLRKQKMSRKIKGLFHAMVNAVVYNIWHARNRKVYQNKDYPVNEVYNEIKTQITSRVLHVHQYKQRYSMCTDLLLNK